MVNTPRNNKSIESDLFIRLTKGDSSALEDLMKAYFPMLCRYAEHFTHDPSMAEDIVQESFIRYWQSGGAFKNLDGVKAFLFTVTKNGALNSIRGRKREEDKLLNAARLESLAVDSIDGEIVKLEFLAEINLFVQQLPEKMKEVFLLSFEEGLTIEEISNKLNISRKTVRNQKYNSLVLLRKQFGHLGIPLLLVITKTLK
ncbi:RNA polymerase sigma factor [Mucilaginibacter ginsenosidivorax]|uniref:Sigma-70 family RNA polymerase sigma factor n=1 Tax=Mucilaginibacter ginsenosidivorax TaxID=862126 RepID=A0A5B8W7M9_9SPHI|nr:sigma-70 family RNA polymerase sigma factor [Mucilaginibacter ginsenosidivorax]QEC78912.1 sigma-70 family RNA polymerase sigma factor [Mucilaginibacter ginsenosidivorax]